MPAPHRCSPTTKFRRGPHCTKIPTMCEQDPIFIPTPPLDSGNEGAGPNLKQMWFVPCTLTCPKHRGTRSQGKIDWVGAFWRVPTYWRWLVRHVGVGAWHSCFIYLFFWFLSVITPEKGRGYSLLVGDLCPLGSWVSGLSRGHPSP